jgi:hypothetical protein
MLQQRRKSDFSHCKHRRFDVTKFLCISILNQNSAYYRALSCKYKRINNVLILIRIKEKQNHKVTDTQNFNKKDLQKRRISRYIINKSNRDNTGKIPCPSVSRSRRKRDKFMPLDPRKFATTKKTENLIANLLSIPSKFTYAKY